MAKLETRTAHGRILAVQEYRFTLLTDDGRGLLLTLDRFAPGGLGHLCTLHEANARVEVDYEGDPDFATGVAYQIREIEANP
jgi:hypothetical protein